MDAARRVAMFLSPSGDTLLEGEVLDDAWGDGFATVGVVDGSLIRCLDRDGEVRGGPGAGSTRKLAR